VRASRFDADASSDRIHPSLTHSLRRSFHPRVARPYPLAFLGPYKTFDDESSFVEKRTNTRSNIHHTDPIDPIDPIDPVDPVEPVEPVVVAFLCVPMCPMINPKKKDFMYVMILIPYLVF